MSNIVTVDGYIQNSVLFNKTAGIVQKKPVCHLEKNVNLINYKNVELLKQYITKGRGRIIPRRITGLPVHIHKKIAHAIKIARKLGLLSIKNNLK